MNYMYIKKLMTVITEFIIKKIQTNFITYTILYVYY